MTSQPGKKQLQFTCCPIGQLIEYSMWNIFHEKSYTKCGGGTIPRHFSKK